jgi:1,2-phenylacetyl-CoA epoxidase PaaB subunit
LYSRALRWSCVVLALIAIAAATFLLIRSEQQLREQTATLRAFDQHAHDASAALVDARVGQQAYVAAGQGSAFWIVKTAAAIQSATDELTALRQLADAGALTALDRASATVVEFSAVDKRARDYLASDQQLMAGDVIFTEGSDAAATSVRQIESARLAQHQAADLEAAAVRNQQALTAGAAVGIVFLVVLLLVAVPRAEAAGTASLSILPTPVPAQPVASPPSAVRVAPLTSHAQGSVLKAATAIVTEFGRVRDLDALTSLLGRAAEVMDASGLMVWMGDAAGSDLRPVLAHGYSAKMISRIPLVPRSADNAAAAAYRSGTLQIVRSHVGGSSGAVVAPILAADGCIGALSAEIRDGGETSDSVQALAVIFAAQLAGVLTVTAPAEEIHETRAAASS